ncbi:TPA: hypothetical protein DCZ46_02725 [Candidatus Campbellbacteria bacterium]|uniref:Uncharacterized protein n=2 Tax=Candidatus Campbelliibacteriota TaxID=1752727 RepID=A0A1F5EPC2_9BACT|nr:MAG: protein of unknown function with transmembrane region [Candidatus Campbellbacteria bacterium GW2011_OD1_34_28]KKP74958.1 MAG: hypothetical protein UR74_C0002G0224 [Candidatus Campbellbacteria bacterium GW2011_GWD2_35_24]KKP75844.1 MAG: hypothetical protein UR75_C0002G0225 [Candidatus Campbellbacteria bacterium GW2011_GWC2_35_28]KKP76908.1 MAG: hypothetical protein UR76_C0002G0109 [Candidatus Campbellbacteria bacterium GW2011_GWC1_35_31]KKP78834.1 MAG: hypothetical protein UR79_C0002G010
MEYFDPELQNLMRENLKVANENNELLHKIWRDVQYKRFLKFFYWGIIIAITFGAYYYIQPIIDSISENYGSLRGGLDVGIKNFQKINDLIPKI